mmetsp:Transcript_15532/g.42912  ORF Transcript_15532/g.42912 Transcript_15532/m.42912 type:complete len:325 (-) Transcript_15532:1255-2229(-)
MFEVSWGELIVLSGVATAVIGPRDLPRVFRTVGTQVGRIVGLLQGARARADQFAAKNELRQLQNELRSELRQLDQVRTELAVAASSQGIVGRGLGASVASANRTSNARASAITPNQKPSFTNVATGTMGAASMAGIADGAVSGLLTSPASPSPSLPARSNGGDADASTEMFEFSIPASATVSASDASSSESIEVIGRTGPTSAPTSATVSAEDMGSGIPPSEGGGTAAILAPQVVSERATMEEEWDKQGIGFRSVAERGEWMGTQANVEGTSGMTGSQILENIIKQNLIFDQYDRVVGEQEREVQERVERIKAKRSGTKDEKKG